MRTVEPPKVGVNTIRSRRISKAWVAFWLAFFGRSMAGVWHRAPSGKLNCRFRRLRKRIRKSIPCCFSKTSSSCTAPESNKPSSLDCTECTQNRRWRPCLACRRAEDKAIDSDSMGTGVRRSAMSGSSSQATHAAEHSSLPERRLPCNSSKIEDLVEDHGPPYKGPDAFVGASPFVGASFVFGAVVLTCAGVIVGWAIMWWPPAPWPLGAFHQGRNGCRHQRLQPKNGLNFPGPIYKHSGPSPKRLRRKTEVPHSCSKRAFSVTQWVLFRITVCAKVIHHSFSPVGDERQVPVDVVPARIADQRLHLLYLHWPRRGRIRPSAASGQHPGAPE